LNSIQHNLVGLVVASDDEVLKNIKHGKSLRRHINKIESQINELFERVDMANEHFWSTLIEPGHHLSARPESHSLGTIEEMQLTLKYNYRSWIKTPGAMTLSRPDCRIDE
jgi:hypothetical protein